MSPKLRKILQLSRACLAAGAAPGWGCVRELPVQAEPVCTALNLFRALRLAPQSSQACPPQQLGARLLLPCQLRGLLSVCT